MPLSFAFAKESHVTRKGETETVPSIYFGRFIIMFCKNCGKEIDDKAAICPNCGVPTEQSAVTPAGTNPSDAPSTGFAVLSFFFPLVGLILWLVWKNEYPLKAKSCGKGALIGVIVEVAIYVIALIIGFIAGLSGMAASSILLF